MEYQELKQKSVAELQSHLDETRALYYRAKDEVLSGTEGNYGKLKSLKKEIAQTLTCLNEQKGSKEA